LTGSVVCVLPCVSLCRSLCQIMCHVSWNWLQLTRQFCKLLTDGVDSVTTDSLPPYFIVRRTDCCHAPHASGRRFSRLIPRWQRHTRSVIVFTDDIVGAVSWS
jgi:hypothetical protein